MDTAVFTISKISFDRYKHYQHQTLTLPAYTHTYTLPSKKEAHKKSYTPYAPWSYSDHLCSAEYPRHESHGVGELIGPKGLGVNGFEGSCARAVHHVDFKLFTPCVALIINELV